MANDARTKTRATAKLNLPNFRTIQADIVKAAEDFLKERLNKIAKDAKQNLSGNEWTGTLKDSIATKVKTGKYRAWLAVGVDAKKQKRKAARRGGKDRIMRPARYAHLIENGFTHYPDGSVIDAKPFMRPAIAKNGGISGFTDTINDAIEIALKNQNLKSPKK